MSREMPLDALLAGCGTANVPALPVSGLCLDSRELRRGDVFFALAGSQAHGLAHAERALHDGAAAIVYEPPLPAALRAPDGAIAVAGLRAHLGAIASRFYDAPSQALRVIGVTGTNGKTSTVQLLAQALTRAGRCVGSIGTLGSGLHGHLAAGERTTPDVLQVHRLLAQMREQGATDVAMEVSSHALDQGRVDAVAFQVAVFSNLTRDHLDYHGTMQAYGAAKAKLFRWPGLGAAVLNLDDPFAAELRRTVADGVPVIGVSARGVAEATLAAEQVEAGDDGLRFVLRVGATRLPLRTALVGRFNVDNLLAVAGTLHALGWPASDIADALAALRPVPGRMSRVGGGAQPLVVVDYAHTPDALAQALRSVREHARGRVLCVFGCGGERDAGKRPQMAAIAEAEADVVIVTDDNPRNESGDAIVAGILAGFAARARVRVERDRAGAIALAIAEARTGDVVLIAGKGHETYQDVAGRRLPFDDLAVAQAALGVSP